MIKLVEHTSKFYAPRTKYNATMGDVTVAFAHDLETHGEQLTKKLAGSRYIGFLIKNDTEVSDIVKKLYAFMVKKNARTLNIAGNGIYTLKKFGCDQRVINVFLYFILSKLYKNYPIETVYTGGQTGVDIGGGVVAHALGINVIMTFPEGFKQRYEEGKDIFQTEESIQMQLINWKNLLVEDLKLIGEYYSD